MKRRRYDGHLGTHLMHGIKSSLIGELALRGPGTIRVAAAAAGHDFETTAEASTFICVLDLLGADKDLQVIRLCHVSCDGAPGTDGAAFAEPRVPPLWRHLMFSLVT